MSDMERFDGRADRIRVGTAEREDTARFLGTAMAEGRLTMAEYEQRLDAVWTSSTRGELARLTDDLPVEKPADPPAESTSSKEWREYFDEWRWWFGGAVIMTGIWGFQSISEGELNGYWPGWPLGIWALILVAMIFFPDDKDDDEDEKR
ncbi:DUF1707 domain-containing protein [Rhodococcus sp. Eu-32]|uniref:DUF1707 SHOCT-like domain-containing protein n=1 Tax=Rhodococcus sp. Eu-32 TaxID=1017319 RepID=UPI001FB45D3E|nr:DUF1707 domain-containing protein [Rhodococcus sp. Eu-32]